MSSSWENVEDDERACPLLAALPASLGGHTLPALGLQALCLDAQALEHLREGLVLGPHHLDRFPSRDIGQGVKGFCLQSDAPGEGRQGELEAKEKRVHHDHQEDNLLGSLRLTSSPDS